MKCFVTGATGFLGSHVARQLLAKGAELRLLVRPTSRLDNIADCLPSGSSAICAIQSRCARECRVASSFFMLLPTIVCGRANGQELYESNVEGTRNILQAARDSGVRRVIYTSSVATMGFGNNGHLTDEAVAGKSRQHDWRLQAQQVHGGASGHRGGAEPDRMS